MVPIDYAETSVINHHSSLCNNPGERSSQVKPSCTYYKDKEEEYRRSTTESQPWLYRRVVSVTLRPLWPRDRTSTPIQAEAWGAVKPVWAYFTGLEMRKSPTKLRTYVLPAISLLAIPNDYTTGSSGFREILQYETDKSAPLFSNFCMRTNRTQNGGLRVFRHSTGSRVLRTSTWDEEGNKE